MRLFIFAGYDRRLSLTEAIERAEQEFPGYRVVGGREIAMYWSLILEEI